MNEPLSNIELAALVGVTPEQILKYSDLRQFDDIDDLFTLSPFRIVLLEDDVKKGHWVIVFKVDGIYYYFNSYGTQADYDLDVVPRLVRMCLGESRREFRRLLHGRKMWHNPVKWQGATSQTCGRWVALVATLARVGFSGPEANEYLKQNVKNDEGIVHLIKPTKVDF